MSDCVLLAWSAYLLPERALALFARLLRFSSMKVADDEAVAFK